MAAKKARYRVVHGLDYSGKRAEPGDVVTDLPAKSVPWLLEQAHIVVDEDEGDDG